jgi:hypothetical protein
VCVSYWISKTAFQNRTKPKTHCLLTVATQSFKETRELGDREGGEETGLAFSSTEGGKGSPFAFSPASKIIILIFIALGKIFTSKNLN